MPGQLRCLAYSQTPHFPPLVSGGQNQNPFEPAPGAVFSRLTGYGSSGCPVAVAPRFCRSTSREARVGAVCRTAPDWFGGTTGFLEAFAPLTFFFAAIVFSPVKTTPRPNPGPRISDERNHTLSAEVSIVKRKAAVNLPAALVSEYPLLLEHVGGSGTLPHGVSLQERFRRCRRRQRDTLPQCRDGAP